MVLIDGVAIKKNSLIFQRTSTQRPFLYQLERNSTAGHLRSSLVRLLITVLGNENVNDLPPPEKTKIREEDEFSSTLLGKELYIAIRSIGIGP